MTTKPIVGGPIRGAQRRATYRSQWAAQFFVAAELSRRGYLVSLTLGHAPSTDLLVESPRGVPLAIEVKGQARPTFWLIRPVTRPREHRYYILVSMETGRGDRLAAPRYFVMTAQEVHEAREAYRRHIEGRGGRQYRDALGGFNWSAPREHEDRWEKLPG